MMVMEDGEHNKRRAAYWLTQRQLIRKLPKLATAPRQSRVLCSDPIAHS
jgi:hypothetical protein